MSRKDAIKNVIAAQQDLTAVQIASVLGVTYHQVANCLLNMVRAGEIQRSRDEGKGPGFFNEYRYSL